MKRRKPHYGEGDQIERITLRERERDRDRVRILGGGWSRGEARRAREVSGARERRGFCVRLSRERDCTMVGPLYRDPRPAAQLLISSTAHQSLVHDPPSRKVSLSLSLPAPISQPQPGRTP